MRGWGLDAGGARKLKLAYEISVRGAWLVGGGDIKPRRTLFGSCGAQMVARTGWCTIRKEAEERRGQARGEGLSG